MFDLRRWFWGALLCVGCSAAGLPGARAPRERIDVPDEVALYSTDAKGDGVVGGARADALARDVAAELEKRGTHATSDGALSAAASWLLREGLEGRSPGAGMRDAAARRFGFAGVVISSTGFALDDAHEGSWRLALAQVPPNLPLTRYGVSVSRSGRFAAVVFGAMELSLLPFARHLSLGEGVLLRGEIGARFASARVYLTKPDGSVEERRMPSRKVEASFTFTKPGSYQLEVMGDGASGPVIVSNVPLFVGVEEERVNVTTGHTTSPAEAEARLLILLNRSRQAAGIKPLQPDDELRAIALAHSTDMVEHHFVGHVSPTTGSSEDRVRRAGVVLLEAGENIAQSNDAESAHDELMASPGHRANMLRRSFTHVGIAARRTDSGPLAVTLIFAQRADPTTMPRTAEQVESAFLALRRKKGLSAPAADATYRAAAAAGIAAYVAASNPTIAIAARAQDAVLTRAAQRAHGDRPTLCSIVIDVLELGQLDGLAALSDPHLRRFGLAAELREDSHGSRLSVMLLLEGASCN